MNAFKYIEGLTFQTEIGQQLHSDIRECITEIIKPEIISKANKFLENGRQETTISKKA